MKNRTAPNADQKRWLERVAQFAYDHGSFPHLRECGFDLHHVVGRTGKHNKQEIGQWFVLPIESQYHDVNSNNPFNVTHYPERYEIEFKPQRDQFFEMIETILYEDGSLPFTDEELAIMDYPVRVKKANV